jgi:hypothetical protein
MSITTKARFTSVLAATTAAAALSVLSAGTADAARAPGPGGHDCQLVRFYLYYNPSINKPRGDQSTPDHRTWADGCV